MQPLDSIALQLARLYNERAELGLAVWSAERDTAAQALAITPAEGWPGKNAEQRDTAKALALVSDPIIHAATVTIENAHTRLEKVSAAIEGLEAERRAAEWEIRARLVEALERRNIQPNARGDRAEAGFDDVPLAEAEEELMPF